MNHGALDIFKEYLQTHTAITDAQFDQLRPELLARRYEKGQLLGRPGDTEGYGYFVAAGLLRSYTIDGRDKEHILQFAPEHWWMADRDNLYFRQPATLYIEVIEEAEVVLMKKDFLDRAQEACKDMARFNVLLLHNFIRFQQRRISQLLGATAEERYLDFITLYPNVLLRVPQHMVASYLGITPESLSRVRRELAERHRSK